MAPLSSLPTWPKRKPQPSCSSLAKTRCLTRSGTSILPPSSPCLGWRQSSWRQLRFHLVFLKESWLILKEENFWIIKQSWFILSMDSGSSSKHVCDANEAVRCQRVTSHENPKQGCRTSYQCKRGANPSFVKTNSLHFKDLILLLNLHVYQDSNKHRSLRQSKGKREIALRFSFQWSTAW